MAETVIITSPTSETVVEVGYSQPAGGGGSGSSYQQEFTSPSVSWSIDHGLGYHPAVTATDMSGREIIGDVTYTGLNTLTVTFTIANSGWVYCS